jgi:hypothetical protein
MSAAAREERPQARQDRERQADLRQRLNRMTPDGQRRENVAEAERRLDAMRQERDAAQRRYGSLLRLELQRALSALGAAPGQERVHPLAPYSTRAVPGDPAAVEAAEAVVALIRAAIAEESAAVPR